MDHVTRLRRRAAGALLVVAIALLFARTVGGGWGDNLRPTGSAQTATVTRVVDGDTVIARGEDGADLGRVRILGIDAPELGRDGQPEMCGAAEAKTAAAELLEGKTVRLVEDSHPDQAGTDRYGRHLRYVEIQRAGETVDASEYLIRSGHAPNTSRRNGHDRYRQYAAAQDDAITAGRGLWARCR